MTVFWLSKSWHDALSSIQSSLVIRDDRTVVVVVIAPLLLVSVADDCELRFVTVIFELAVMSTAPVVERLLIAATPFASPKKVDADRVATEISFAEVKRTFAPVAVMLTPAC